MRYKYLLCLMIYASLQLIMYMFLNFELFIVLNLIIISFNILLIASRITNKP